jgi:hypothetical protein
MTSQNWIYDPPPPPPPKKPVPGSTDVYNSQQPVNGRDKFRGNTRGNVDQQRRFVNRKSNNNRQQQSVQQNGNMAPQLGYQSTHFPTGYQTGRIQPSATFQPPLGYPLANFAYQYPVQQQYYPYAPQPYPQSQPIPPDQVESQPHLSRPLPVYQTQQNVFGYTMSSTAYSLPEHHYKPHPSERPDISEEELRFQLEQQMKKIKPR